ncbi:MAG: nickel pincer cofactor biosynthesis protein LarB [Halanaerobiaceae bacterium]
MYNRKLRTILKGVQEGSLTIDKALAEINDPGYQDIGIAKIDHNRNKRRGFPEVVLAEGKTSEQVAQIMKALASNHENILATRATEEDFQVVKSVLANVKYNKLGRVIIRETNPLPRVGSVLVVCAGTSDLPVVEETAETLSIMGNKVEKLADAGVAGVHRLLNNIEYLNRSRVIIVVAGMDGALPSVVAGLVSKPVIAVPTSVGYGASFNGLAALLTMLNSCAAGVGVVNIDNGFGAAYLANSINKLGENVE